MLTEPRLAQSAVGAIAYDAGFGDLSYFNRSFKRRFGATPRDVRNEGTSFGTGCNELTSSLFAVKYKKYSNTGNLFKRGSSACAQTGLHKISQMNSSLINCRSKKAGDPLAPGSRRALAIAGLFALVGAQPAFADCRSENVSCVKGANSPFDSVACGSLYRTCAAHKALCCPAPG
jgi:hypothetical protein